MADLGERLRRALTRAEDGAGTLPAKESVKLRPADWHRLQDIIREAIPVLAALPKGEPTVKPLEWETLPLGSVVARMPYGKYLAYDNGRALLHFDIIPPARVGNDLEAAKAAAQADYEQRIRSALCAALPKSDAADKRIATLAAEVERLRTALRPFQSIVVSWSKAHLTGHVNRGDTVMVRAGTIIDAADALEGKGEPGPFQQALAVLDALPSRPPDDTPLRDILPGLYPTVGDLRALFATHQRE